MLLLKWLIAIIAIGFVGWKIWTFKQHNELFDFQWSVESGALISITVLLGILNWSFEAMKWKRLLSGVLHLSFFRSFASVMQGVTTAIITPNRLGSFIGRVGGLPKEHREKGVLLTLLSGLAQFSITIGFGLVGWVIVYGHKEWLFVLLCILFIGLGLWLFFNPKTILRPFIMRFLKQKIVENILSLQDISISLKIEILGLSVLRFLTFSFQYVLILFCFPTINDTLTIWSHVLVVYGLMTILPGLFFGKLFIREAAALIVFPLISFADNEIILAGLIVWLINIGLPASTGAFMMMKSKQWFNSSTQQS